ncbi:autoinducer-binding transcriptional regulator, LuxR family domain protein [Burkholderia pseudomallei]|nr:autoinducer-binding transcriptional regulator, LuxR family domain protein [Burkholderia pseudomallei]
MPLPIRCGEGPSPQQRGAPRAARRRARVARRERYVRRRDRGRRVCGRSCGHVLFDRRPTLASCVSSPPTITRSGLQRSFGARRLARHAYEGAWRSMFAACRGGVERARRQP